MPPKRTPRVAGGPDPYYARKASIQEKVRALIDEFNQWKYILEKKNTSTDPNFSSLLSKIRTKLEDIGGDIKQVSKINTHVESHRDRFENIDDAELKSRREFVLSVEAQLLDINTFLESDRVTEKINQDRSTQTVKLKAGQSSDQYVQKRRMDTRSMEDEQDAVIDDMSGALSRLNVNAGTIQTQLYTQTELIEEMDQRLDDNQNAIDVALNKMDAVLGKSAKGKWTIIIIEIIIALVLLLLIAI